MTRRAKGIFQWASLVSCENQNLRVNFDQLAVNFDQGKRNLVQVSGELELSEFELSE